MHFINGQHEEEWEQDFEFDSQLMVVKAPPTNGVPAFGNPVHVVDLEDGGTDMPFSVIGRQTIWGHQIRWTPVGNISVNPTDPEDVTIVYADRGTPNPNATDPAYEGCLFEARTQENDYDPCDAHGTSTPMSTSRVRRTAAKRGTVARSSTMPTAHHNGSPGPITGPTDRWRSPGIEDTAPPHRRTRSNTFCRTDGGKEALGPEEQVDISVTHWSGQYVPQSAWPTICGPAGYSDPPVTDAEGKDCNVFHGDYTGLAVGPDGAIHVVWTGLNVLATSTQVDGYTGELHDGYRQDAMYAQR